MIDLDLVLVHILRCRHAPPTLPCQQIIILQRKVAMNVSVAEVDRVRDLHLGTSLVNSLGPFRGLQRMRSGHVIRQIPENQAHHGNDLVRRTTIPLLPVALFHVRIRAHGLDHAIAGLGFQNTTAKSYLWVMTAMTAIRELVESR